MSASLPLELAAIVDCMHDGLFIVSPDGTIAMVNDALLRLTGFSRDELLGKPCSMLGCDQCADQRGRGGGWAPPWPVSGATTRPGSCSRNTPTTP